MSNKLNFAAVLALGSVLVACSTAEVARMDVKGGAYEQGLHKGYIALADSEYAEDDWPDGDIFVDRARAAAMGNPSGPEPLSARKLAPPHDGQLAAARQRLVAAWDKGATDKAGDLAAKAQVTFDCWMQEAEENMQPKDIAACRNDFYGHMLLLEAALESPTPPMAAPAPAGSPQQKQFTVYFGLDSRTIGDDMTGIIRQAADFAKSKDGTNVYVTGHTDRAGSREYNEKLAKARAEAVMNALAAQNIKKSAMGSMVYGETDPAVATPDGKAESRNRRVVITILY